MVVVMAPDATEEQIAHVTERVESVGGQAFVSRGVVRTIIGLVGDIDSFHGLNLRSMPGVADVHRISDPFKLVSRQHHPDRSTVWVGPAGHQVPIGPDTFTLIAGPCAVEDAEQTFEAADMAKAAGAALLRLDELVAEGGVREDTAERVRGAYNFRRERFRSRFDEDGDGAIEERSQAYQALMRELLEAERQMVVELRRQGTINDDVMNRVQRDLDLEDSRLDS
jgi:hypothetical protein